MAFSKSPSTKKTVYIVAQGKTVDSLVRVVNEIVEHGWHSEGVVITGWKTAGGITRAQGMYLQSLVHEG